MLHFSVCTVTSLPPWKSSRRRRVSLHLCVPHTKRSLCSEGGTDRGQTVRPPHKRDVRGPANERLLTRKDLVPTPPCGLLGSWTGLYMDHKAFFCTLGLRSAMRAVWAASEIFFPWASLPKLVLWLPRPLTVLKKRSHGHRCSGKFVFVLPLPEIHSTRY